MRAKKEEKQDWRKAQKHKAYAVVTKQKISVMINEDTKTNEQFSY